MAEQDAAAKTEEPTGRKLEQARQKGQSPKTPDLPQLGSLVAAAAVVASLGGLLCRNMAEALVPFIAAPETMDLHGAGGVEVMRHAAMAAAPFLAAVFAAACVAGVAGNLMQTGFVFSPDKLAPDLSRLSPGQGFQRIFSLDGVMQFLKSAVKVALTSVVAWWILRPHWEELHNLSTLDPTLILPFAADLLRRVVFGVAGLLLVIAGGDWFYQRARFMERMKMTKEELKEEFKQADGDPLIKAKLRQMRVQRARRRMMQAVPTATVVVMNPTHYAVALKYDQGENPAPLCVAKGLDAVALRIRALAEESGVPVIEDPPLARALYAAVEIDDIIPPAHYEAVAKIIGFIMSNSRRLAGRVR